MSFGTRSKSNRLKPVVETHSLEIRGCGLFGEGVVLVFEAFEGESGVHVEERAASGTPLSVLVVEEGGRVTKRTDGRDVFHVAPFDGFKRDMDADEGGEKS